MVRLVHKQSKILILCFLCISLNWLTGQTKPSDYFLEDDFEKFNLDDFGNIYTLDSDQVLKKFNKEGKLLFQFSFLRQGTVTDIEVSNPTKLLVFFADYQIILFLDNTLSEIKQLNLEDFGYWNITSVTQSPDNHLWLYDPINFKIIKINEAGKTLYSSNEFYFGKLSNEIQPRLTANLNYTVCYTDSEYMIFSNFGELYRSAKASMDKLLLKDVYLFTLDSDQIIFEPIKPDFAQGPQVLYQSESLIKDFQIDKSGQLFVLDERGIKKVSVN